MNEEHDLYELDEPERESSGRRRKGGRSSSSSVPVWAWLGGGVLALLLVANLVMALVRPGAGGDEGGGGGGSGGFLTPSLVAWLRFWVPVALSGVIAVLGFIWGGVALARYDRKSVRWIRIGFTAAAIVVIMLVLASYEVREYFESVAFLGLATVLAPFAMAARAASTSRHGAGRKRRSGGRSDGDDPAAESAK